MHHLHGNGLIPVLAQGFQIGASHDGGQPGLIELSAGLASGISCFFASHVRKDQDLSPAIDRTFRRVMLALRLHLRESSSLFYMALLFCHNDSLPFMVGVLSWCIYTHHTEYVLENFLKYSIFRKLFRIICGGPLPRHLDSAIAREVPGRSALLTLDWSPLRLSQRYLFSFRHHRKYSTLPS